MMCVFGHLKTLQDTFSVRAFLGCRRLQNYHLMGADRDGSTSDIRAASPKVQTTPIPHASAPQFHSTISEPRLHTTKTTEGKPRQFYHRWTWMRRRGLAASAPTLRMAALDAPKFHRGGGCSLLPPCGLQWSCHERSSAPSRYVPAASVPVETNLRSNLCTETEGRSMPPTTRSHETTTLEARASQKTESRIEHRDLIGVSH
mmetsp:Transcript_55978/g.64233  ORF Transcript_55978/g.64233 Transcript_55978/m.64233 type:complete len:202 (+) Transcript_55978:178-783(+)